MRMGDHRKLLVWQRVRRLVGRVQQLVAELPASERAGRGDQLIRAVTSIRYNIAEGAGYNSDRQFAKHLRYALASANEVQDELDDLSDQNLLADRDRDLPGEVAEIRAMTFALLQRVKGQPKNQSDDHPKNEAAPNPDPPSIAANAESEPLRPPIPRRPPSS